VDGAIPLDLRREARALRVAGQPAYDRTKGEADDERADQDKRLDGINPSSYCIARSSRYNKW
jgi:hypothetical protein